MALGSGIEWTEATWNPTTGCTKVSSGCANCYAEVLSRRLYSMGMKKYRNNFRYTEHASALDVPLKWIKPRRIFVNSMSDMFHEDATFEFVAKCFGVMLRAYRHTYQILTKRPGAMVDFSRQFQINTSHLIPGHIWMGTSVENMKHTYRIDKLRDVKCTVRFVSFEPLLGKLDRINLNKIDWAIIGGESGKGFRSIKKEWVVDIIKQCRAQNVPVFFKQWGGPRPKYGGRLVDGIEYGEYPSITVPMAYDIKLDYSQFKRPVSS